MATTGEVYAGTGATVQESPWTGTAGAWQSVVEATLGGGAQPDNVYANITSASFDGGVRSQVLKLTNYDFSVIPAGATIDGVIVRVKNASAMAGANANMDLVQLLNTSAAKVGTNKASTPSTLTNTDQNFTFGTSTDLWGNALTAAWVKNSNFGVAYGNAAVNNNTDVRVDAISIEVFYTAGGTQAASGTAAVVSTTTGTVAASRPSSGTAAVVSATTGAPAARLAASGTVAAVSTVSGDAGLSAPPQQFPVSGAADAVSAVSGTVAARLPAAGSVAVVSASSGTVAARLPSAVTVAVTSATSGSVAARLPAAGTVSVVSAGSGTVAARRPTSATVPVVSTTTADAGLQAAGAFDCVGTVPIATAVIGAPTARLVTSGTTPVVSTTTGTLKALRPATGITPVVSGTVGALTARRPSSGLVAIVSTITGSAVIIGERAPTPPGRTVITPPESRLETQAGSRITVVSAEHRIETITAQIREVPA